MSQTIIPRPIAWVVTGDEGVVNIAPFSYFTGLSSEPATVIISAGHKQNGEPKDTLANIRKHRKCTICMVAEQDLARMHYSSKELPHEISEAEKYGIETTRLKEGFPPAIESTPVAYFCTLYQEIDLGGGSTVPLILKLQEIYVNDEVLTDPEHLHIDFNPVARIGKSYAFLGEKIQTPDIPS
jgi:flavin reductase (DIM6/NTAB) family NADH-FMN oxidoreductase RutF